MAKSNEEMLTDLLVTIALAAADCGFSNDDFVDLAESVSDIAWPEPAATTTIN